MDRHDAQGEAMNDRMDDYEWLSALADGQLEGEALERALQALAHDPSAREAWQSWHLIGDVLRSHELAAGTAPAVFRQRLMQRLASEAPLPQGPMPAPATAAPVPGPARSDPPANDAFFRWKRAAGALSLLAAVGAGWLSAGALWDPASSRMAGTPPGNMIRDARLDELLSAHRQLGGATALQAPSGFLHNASFERAAPGR